MPRRPLPGSCLRNQYVSRFCIAPLLCRVQTLLGKACAAAFSSMQAPGSAKIWVVVEEFKSNCHCMELYILCSSTATQKFCASRSAGASQPWGREVCEGQSPLISPSSWEADIKLSWISCNPPVVADVSKHFSGRQFGFCGQQFGFSGPCMPMSNIVESAIDGVNNKCCLGNFDCRHEAQLCL